MRRLVLFLAVLIASGCVGDPPRLEDATAAADPVEAEAPEADDPEVRLEALRTRAAAPAQDDVAVWQRLAQQLERENGTLEAQLAQAREEASRAREDAERYRQGLERAVAELNRLGAAAAAETPFSTVFRGPTDREGSYTARVTVR